MTMTDLTFYALPPINTAFTAADSVSAIRSPDLSDSQ